MINLAGISEAVIDQYKSDYENFAWVVALAPADDPQIAAAILKDAGVEYFNLIGTDEIQQQMYSISIPATFFVDSEGNILTEPVVGAYFDLYSQRLEEALTLAG